jgi:hypothetical protein
MTSMTDLQGRLYGMMQYLMSASANNIDAEVPAARDVVTKQDALDAVLGLAAAIDAPTQGGLVPVPHAKHMAALLMVIRDYVQPLPPGLGTDDDGSESDHATRDLTDMVQALRMARQNTGVRG